MHVSRFIGFDDFAAGDVVDEELIFPKRVRLIDSKQFVDVNTELMYLEGDSGNFKLRLTHQLSAFSSMTSHACAYALLAALNSKRKVSTVIGWTAILEQFSREARAVIKGPIRTITLSMYVEWQLSKGASQTKTLRGAILYWIRCGGSGISGELREYLASSKSPPSRGSIEIQHNEPQERPLTFGVVSELLEQVGVLYVNGTFGHQDNAMWRLLISEGLRPSQIRLLQLGDVEIKRDKFGDLISVHLNVPLVKQRGAAARGNFMNTRLADAVSRSIVELMNWINEISKSALPSSNPLFCIRKENGKSASISKRPLSIAARISATSKLLSPILNDERLFSRRLKHTKMTHLAILGADINTLAVAGYQTSTVSLTRYVNLSDEAFLNYEIQMEEHYQSVSDCLSIKVIERQQATNKHPRNTITDLEADGDAGSCAAEPCGAMATLACYVCPRFEAFRDGPHELILSGLLNRKQRAIDKDLPVETVKRDDRII